MPQRPISEIEDEIDKALMRTRSLAAQGLWRVLRYLIETTSDGRCGELRRAGAPLDTNAIAEMFGRTVSSKVPLLLDRLTSAKVHIRKEADRLLGVTADGCFFSLPLREIAQRRESERAKKRIQRSSKTRGKKRVRAGHSTDVPPDVPPLSLPVPPVSPPCTPSSNPLPIPEACASGSGPAGPTSARGISPQARAMLEIWKPRWSAAHLGETYPDESVDFVMIAGILKKLHAGARDETHVFERFAKITDAALEKPEEFGWEGHKLTKVKSCLADLITIVKRKELGVTNGNGKHRRDSDPFADRPLRQIREFGT